MNIRLKSVLVAVGVLLGIAGTPRAQASVEGIRIATVDMQRALQAVKDGKKARQTLEKEFNSKKTELEKEKASIEKMHEELQKQSLVMNEKALAKKQAELQQKVMQLQELTARSQYEIQKREQELTAPIVEKLKGVISKIAKDKGYSVVLEKNEQTVLYSLEKDDLTAQVIDGYDD